MSKIAGVFQELLRKMQILEKGGRGDDMEGDEYSFKNFEGHFNRKLLLVHPKTPLLTAIWLFTVKSPQTRFLRPN